MAVEADKFLKVKRVLWMIFLANVLVAVTKIIIGGLINSNSMTADGFHSLTDGSSNIIGLIGIYFASKPIDEDHPYGHRKFETLAALFIAGMLCVLGIKIVSGAIIRFFEPSVPNITFASLAALLATLGVNTVVSIYEFGKGKILKSDILISDSYHTRSDIYISLGVLITLTGIKLGLPPVIDPITSLVVAVFIFHAAVKIFVPTCGTLSDKAIFDQKLIEEIVSSFEEVKDVHKVRSRGRADDIHMDLHIKIEPTMSVEESHHLIHEIENEIKEKFGGNVHALIHVEPFYENGGTRSRRPRA